MAPWCFAGRPAEQGLYHGMVRGYGRVVGRPVGVAGAWVTFVMTRGLDIPTRLPGEDWAADEDFVVTVAPGIATIGGDVSTEPFTFTFTTREPEVGDAGDTGDGGGETGCGCASGGGGVGWMVVVLAGVVGMRRRS